MKIINITPVRIPVTTSVKMWVRVAAFDENNNIEFERSKMGHER